MAKFKLMTGKEKGKAKLYTEIQRGGLRLMVNSGIVVTIEEWKKAQKSQAAFTKYQATAEGSRVSDQTVKVSQAIDLLFREGMIKTKEDKQLIEKAIAEIVDTEAINARLKAKEAQQKKRHFILTYYREFLNGITTGKIRTTKGRSAGSEFSEGTLSNWKIFGSQLAGYCNESTTFEDIDQDFADGFTRHLDISGYMAGTKSNIIGRFSQLCKRAAADGANNNMASLGVWKRRSAKANEKRATIYLTDEELDAMYQMELKGTRAIVRDMFILGVLTCQRESDFTAITSKNFKETANGTPVLEITQKKTGTTVEVPIFDNRVITIMERYNGKFPHIYLTNFNEYLRDISRELSKTVPSLVEQIPTRIGKNSEEEAYIRLCEDVKKYGLENLTPIKRYRYKRLKSYADQHDGKPLFERDEEGNILRHRWELVSSHTARRSGITNLYRDGILGSRDIMAISGHKTETVFNNYVKATASEKADDIFNKLIAAKAVKTQ